MKQTLFCLLSILLLQGCIVAPAYIEPTDNAIGYLNIPCRTLYIELNAQHIEHNCDDIIRVPAGKQTMKIHFAEGQFNGVSSTTKSGTMQLEVEFKRGRNYRLMAKIDTVSSRWRTWVFDTESEEIVSTVIMPQGE